MTKIGKEKRSTLLLRARGKRRRHKNLALSLSLFSRNGPERNETTRIDTRIIIRLEFILRRRFGARLCARDSVNFVLRQSGDDDDDDDAQHPKRADNDDNDDDDCDENEAKSSKTNNREQRLSETKPGRAFERKLSAVEAPVGKISHAIFSEE